MPCNSDYMNPTEAEQNSKETAEHLVYISKKLSHIKLPDYVKPASKSYYGDVKNLNSMVVLLCDILTTMRQVDLEAIVYNAKSRKSRDLANWWDVHKEADKKRREKEKKHKEKEDKFQKSKAIVEKMKERGVLHDYEWEAVKIYFKGMKGCL